jgi:hypothetical protein
MVLRTRRTSTGFLWGGAIDRDAVFWLLNQRLFYEVGALFFPLPSSTGKGEGSPSLAVPKGQPTVTNTAVVFFFQRSTFLTQYYNTPLE